MDPDDRLSDVVDDREQILASFEDGDGAHHHGGGDGASGSSVGTGSPDIFHVSYRRKLSTDSTRVAAVILILILQFTRKKLKCTY